ncbi:AAA family ATPase [Falsiroseomonas sp.]|uniref:AAA family ATPase n=1 Tax=Falsiroseomonas sp. TaxID=2870721 RepID=UPI003F72FF6E
MADYRGARGSNTGDDFHELWATRQAIGLLNAEGGLEAVALEGTLEPGAADTWDGVDCTLYFGGVGATSAERVRLEQLKYSGSSPDTPWTVARLTYVRPPAKTAASGRQVSSKVPAQRGSKPGTSPARVAGDGSVLSRMAKAWLEMSALRPGKPPPEVALVTNQPIAPELKLAFDRSAADPSATASMPQGNDKTDEAKLLQASGLTADQFREFAACIDLVSSTGSRFALEDRVLRAMAEWSDDDARADTLMLRQFVRQRMLPEHDRSPITREGVMLQALGASDRHALFPCPPDLKPTDKIVRRAAVDQASRFLADKQFVCVHGEGGVGKTTALRQIENDLPEGSLIVIFDCYGGGRYLEPSELRHHPADAFTQLANEIAARLRLPLLLRRHGATDFPRMFMERLRRAATVLAARSSDALLVVAVDAADNSVTAARERPLQEPSFVHDFVLLKSLPANVRFIVTARTGRLDLLGLPDNYLTSFLPAFELGETAEFVYQRRGTAHSPEWIDEFHALSGGIPRVQAYAFEGGAEDRDAPLARLRPGKSLDAVFEERFREAIAKNGGAGEVGAVCAGLIALARPVPLAALAAVLETNEHQVRDVCRDLAPGVRLDGNAAALADEDFETFVRERGKPELAGVRKRAVIWLLSRAATDAYAAIQLAPALAAAEYFKELLDLVEREPVPSAVRDPIQKREVEVQRLSLAVAASRAAGEPSRALRYLLIGAEGHRKDEALQNLLAGNPDLAARFAADTVGRLLLSDPDYRWGHGRLLYHRLVVHAERGDALSYREDRRAIAAWNQARQLTRQDVPERSRPWPIDSEAVAADIEAALKMRGPVAALRQLKRWSPRSVHADVALQLPPRLIADGRMADLEALLASGQLGPLAGAFLRVPLALAGRDVDEAALEAGLLRLSRLLQGGKDLDNYLERDARPARLIDLLLTGCEILTARAPACRAVDVILTRLLQADRRRIDRHHASNSLRLDAVFRAYALLEARSGRRPKASDVFEPRREVAKEGKSRASSNDYSERHDREMVDLARIIFPSYAAVSCALAGLDVGDGAIVALRIATRSLEQERWRLDREPGLNVTRSFVARNLLTLLAAGHVPGTLREVAMAVYGAWTGGEAVPDAALVSRLSLRPELHDSLITSLVSSASATRDLRLGSQSKSESLVAHARLLGPISPEDAGAVFQMAVTAAGELDTEIRGQLILVEKLVRHACRAVPDRRAMALRLGEVVADAAVRLEGDDHFPWPEASTALARLDQPIALAAASRWEARGLVELGETLPSVLRIGLVDGCLTPGEVAGLSLCLETDHDLVEESLRASLGLPAVTQWALREEAARDMLLRPGRPDASENIRSAPEGEIGQLARALVDRERFRQGLVPPRKESCVAEPRQGDAGAAAYAWTPEVTTNSATLAAAIRMIRQSARAREAPVYVPLRSILSDARAVVPLRLRTRHLDAVAALGEEYGDAELAKALIETLGAWDNPAVNAWCEKSLPGLLRDLLPALAPGLPYGTDEINPLLARTGMDHDDRRDFLLGAVQAHVEALGPEALIGHVGLIADLLPAPSVASLLEWYVDRLASRIRHVDLERVSPQGIPEDSGGAIGRFLMAKLGCPDIRIRWRAAHAVLRISRTGDLRSVNGFVRAFGRLEEFEFSGPPPAYYPLAARLWATVTLDRVAAERPDKVVAAASALMAMALDDQFPHLLLRAFARDACLKLVAACSLPISPQEAVELAAVNRSALPAVKAENRYSREDAYRVRSREGRRFGFDGMDTVKNWYAPFWYAFAEPVGAQFLDIAERWIVDVWGWPEESVRSAPLLPWRLRQDREYSAYRHRQGSRPIIEDLRTHLEWHAMWCAAGELVKSVPLAEGEPDDFHALDYKVLREQLAEPPLWAAELRVPVPLHSRHWTLASEPLAEWVAAVRESDHQVVMIPPEREGYVTVAGHEETTGPDRYQEGVVASALVDPSTAPALLRALQTIDDSWDYKLPLEGEGEFEFGDPPYQLLGWLVRPDRGDGIDEHDPFRGQARYVMMAPGARVFNASGLIRDASGAARWSRPGATKPMFVFEAWGEKVRDDEQYESDICSAGWRLLAHGEQLQEFLQHERLDLIIEVEVRRRGRRTRRYAGEEDVDPPQERFDRLYRLAADGTLDIAEGHFGSWSSARLQS